jgi:hypothetical protein
VVLPPYKTENGAPISHVFSFLPSTGRSTRLKIGCGPYLEGARDE